MAKDQSVEQDFNLNDQRPLAGEVRTYPLGEALFFSPKPLPSARILSGGLGESNQILEINDTYMDIGQSNHGKAFQVQLVMSCIMLMMTVFLLIFFLSLP
ncbi:hypothetical protein [Vibrio sp. TRT 17S01]|uniref:hypothetical protein n=1 Tax=Vibrio sp. TRT 17S01 TaxID=3418505 RepID=UPI003CE685F5